MTAPRPAVMGALVFYATFAVFVLFALGTGLFAYETLFGDPIFLIPMAAMLAGMIVSFGILLHIHSLAKEGRT